MNHTPSRRQTVGAAALGLLIAAAFLWWVASPGSVRSKDAYDYAQMGREIARGNGLTTLQIFPRHIPFIHERGLLDGPWPNLHRYPLPTLGNALGYAVDSDPRGAALLQSAAMYLAGVTAFAAAARRLAPLGVTALLTALFAADPVVLSAASKGLTEGMAMLWVIGLIGFIARPEGVSRTDAALAGLMCGLGWLTRTQLAVLLPVALIAVALRSTNWRTAGWCLLGAALPVAPFLVRNVWLTGSPTFSFSTTRNLALQAAPQDIDMVLDAPVQSSGVWAEHGDEISRKIRKNLGRITSLKKLHMLFAELSGPALALVGLSGAAALRRNKTIVLGALAMIAGTFVAVSLAFHSSRFYDPLRPLVYLWLAAGAATAWHALPTRPRWVRRVAVVAWLVTLLWALMPTVEQGPLYGRGPRPLYEDRLVGVNRYIPVGSVVVSDDSARTAMAAGLRSIRLPILPDDLIQIDAEYIQVDALVLSRRVFTDSPDRNTVFANYWRYSDAVATEAFTDRWAEVGRVRNHRVFLRKADAPPAATERHNR